MKIVWTFAARQDRDEIFDHIAAEDPGAAERLDMKFETSTLKLADFPFLARPGEIPGTRELIPHPNYRIVYQVLKDTILILGIVHASRQWPLAFEEGA